MKFAYEGFDAQGERQTGLLEAGDKLEALRQLQAKNIVPVELDPLEDKRRPGLFAPRLSRQHITQALHELTRLIESEVSIAESIEAMADAGHHEKIDHAFTGIARALQHGESFSEALARCGLPLPDYLLHLVRAGELTGDLAGALKRAQEKMEYDERTANELRNALTYPAILVVSGVAAVLLMFIVVVPKFSGMLDKNATELPWLATFVLTTGTWFNAHWDLLLAGLACALAIAIGALRRPGLRASLTNWLSRLPVIGRWLDETDMASWSYTLSAMLGCKVDLLAALELSIHAMRIPRKRAAMQEVIRLVRSGSNVSSALAETHMLNRTGINLVKVGERTGRAAEMLSSLATLYEDNSKNRMKKLLALIEPAAILLIGSVIGVIILGIILAITSVNDMAI
ncbi:type II secretion system protein [Azotobacter vinelandii CA]|uniref:Type II secretion system protein n=2 Tax=Azotobacter vinelandii TaxID=354 RepID=C1DRU3_AZOVD|nr:type II secretion system F family protein [Azotobacter vinelandii]ACO77831.1 type II secretion system protein [Azotobacter vinelandii DJ]AGK16965.1 type II secretion system protein [Azotobacter vinelandii CA]AGK20006.1 type II secretion system protein [Azotobacter vinelandii CA6]SFX86479.1 general secretion pathway protein F [Azotobacter vinelandii]